MRPATFGKGEKEAMDELAKGNLAECFEKLLGIKSIQKRHKHMMKSLLKLHWTKEARIQIIKQIETHKNGHKK